MNHTEDHKHNHHQQHQEHEEMDHSAHGTQFKRRFFISLLLSIPIILFSPMMGITLPFQVTFTGSNWIVLIFGTLVYFYGGMPFLEGAKQELKQKNPAMMTLISLGISVSYFYSVYIFILNIINPGNHLMDFFWELATLIDIMLLGHWIEMNAVSNAGNALKKMAELLPSTATLLHQDGSTTDIPLSDVKLHDTLLVKAGQKIPTDGTILSGETSVNESMITGESKEISKAVGDKVIGGSTNGAHTITIDVTGTGESGYLSQVMNLVSQAQQDKSHVESLSDKVARLLFYVAVIVSIIAFIVWIMITKNFSTGLERMVTVLVIACPHALGLAIPLVTARSISIGAQNGLLVKNRQSLETAQHVDVIMMDKTGTLTEGIFQVNEYQSFDKQYTKEQVLSYFATLETHSTHPLAVSIVKKAKEDKVDFLEATNVTTIPGVGLQGDVDQQLVKIVSLRYLKENQISFNDDLFNTWSSKGNSISYLIVNDKLIGFIAQGDTIKPESKMLISTLQTLGIEPIMLTGDNKQTAQLVANELGMTTFYSELMPEDKEKIIRSYKDKDQIVMMVGDGINDAPALARASIGVAIGAGTDVAIDSADVILVKSNPIDILQFLSLSKNTSRKMKENLWWGAGYNIFAIPLAAGVLAPIGFILSPAVGAVLMSLSTIIVAVNAMSLKIDKTSN